ncbi:MAG: hypothetical protein Fur0037_21850 [Planctomycetota bacterium]
MNYHARQGDLEREIRIERHGLGIRATIGEKTVELDLSPVGDGGAFSMIVDGRSYDVLADVEGQRVAIQMLGERCVATVEDDRERAAQSIASHRKPGVQEIRAAMPGIVVDVRAVEGKEVAEGETLVVLEAMKMQNPLPAEHGGTVRKVHVEKGATVSAGDLLVEIE